MSDHVIDLIDNAIDQHGDAMRWSPSRPESADGDHMLVSWNSAGMFRLDLSGNALGWGDAIPVAANTTYDATFDLYWDAADSGAIVDAMVMYGNVYLAERQDARVRRSAIHSAYRRRRR